MASLPFFVLILLALLGLPLFAVMGGLGLYAFNIADIDTSAVGIEIYRLAQTPTLITIPLFTFAGYLLAESKSPQRILNFAHAAFGWIPGGVAIVSLIVCAFFTAFTGASGVTIIALGGLLFPILSKEGFSEKFNLGLITTSGSLGLLFAPSLPIILYGLVAKVDIDKLFLAGIIPGIILILALSLYSLYIGKSNLKKVSFSFATLKTSARQATGELLLPIGILWGIYGGITTPTEASALTALYVFVLEFFIYKDLKLNKDLIPIVKESMTLVSSILIILCCALGLTNYLIDEEIPLKILNFMQSSFSSKWSFLLVLNIFLLVVGALMDIFSAIIVVVPLILPIAAEFGIDPLHLAVIFLTNLEIGYITPPVGINLFISSTRFNRPITDLYKYSIPFLIILLICLILITYVPILSLIWFN